MFFRSFIFLICMCIGDTSNLGAFDKMIKQKNFHVQPSQKNLSHLHEASTLVISCVDFRLRDETADLLNRVLKLEDQYDEIALPGASLAFVEKTKAHWGQTIEDCIQILKDLHHIKKIIFIDHLECGAYKLLKGKEAVSTHEKEKAAHLKAFKDTRKKMKKLFPDLQVYTFLMGLDGNVENVR